MTVWAEGAWNYTQANVKCRLTTTPSFTEALSRYPTAFRSKCCNQASVQIFWERVCLSLQDPTGAGISNRLAPGWRKFWALKRMLLPKRYSLNKRLKLFNATVAECVLWATESWTPRAAEIDKLRVTQKAMRRHIVGCPRSCDEQWIESLQRSTNRARHLTNAAGVREWAIEHYRRKWRWTGKVARLSVLEWARLVTTWRDSEWQACVNDWGSCRPMRPSRRRWMRFEDASRQYCREHGLVSWQRLAQDAADWQAHAEGFESWAVESRFNCDVDAVVWGPAPRGPH